jgi:hypothetical protein
MYSEVILFISVGIARMCLYVLCFITSMNLWTLSNSWTWLNVSFWVYVSCVLQRYWHIITWICMQIYYGYLTANFQNLISQTGSKNMFFHFYAAFFSAMHQRFIYRFLLAYLSVLFTYFFFNKSFRQKTNTLYCLRIYIYIYIYIHIYIFFF